MDEVDLNRAKILGSLIRDARLQADRSMADCARVIDLSEDDFARLENGEMALSLPALEALAMYLQVPMSYFWGGRSGDGRRRPDYQSFMMLRQRIIGAMLRQARVQSRRSIADLAAEIGESEAQIQAYEMGSEAAPLFQLERMAKSLGVNLDFFSGVQHGPLARHEAEQKMRRRFDELPPKVQAFVVEPINLSYLETAMRLSELDVHRLRNIAEGILDITF